jgi:hypothetical protein
LFERTLLEQMNQRAEAVLLNTNLSPEERAFLRGELSYGMYAITLPREMAEVAKAGLQLLFGEKEVETDE